jgi:hypothetical protein
VDNNVLLGAPARWLSAPIDELAGQSPQVALARAMGVPLRPYLLNIRATMVDTTTTVGPFSWSVTGGVSGGVVENTRLFQFAIVDRMVFEIDQPQANAGTQLKPLTDFFFGLQSGIQANMVVDPTGSGYSVTSDFTPLRSLMAMTNEAWAYGWVLGYTESIKMQFVPSVLMQPPTTVICTFRLWQPARCLEEFTGLTDSRAIEKLQSLGYSLGRPKKG